MRFIELYTRPFLSSPSAMQQLSLKFLGLGKGHTRGVLSVSTSATIGVRFPAWFISCLVLSLSPAFLLVASVSWGPGKPFSELDARTVGLAICLVSFYWSFVLLIFGSCLTVFDTHFSPPPRANRGFPVVFTSSGHLCSQPTYSEASFPCFIHAERPNAKVSG